MIKQILSESVFEIEASSLFSKLYGQIDADSKSLPDRDKAVRPFFDEALRVSRKLTAQDQSDVVQEALYVLAGSSKEPTGTQNLRGGAGYALYKASAGVYDPRTKNPRHDNSVTGFLNFLCRREAEKRKNLSAEVLTEKDEGVFSNTEDPLDLRMRERVHDRIKNARIMITWLQDRVLLSGPEDLGVKGLPVTVMNLRTAFTTDWGTIQDRWWRPFQQTLLDAATDVKDFGEDVLEDLIMLAQMQDQVSDNPMDNDILRTAIQVSDWFQPMPPFPQSLRDANGERIPPDPPPWWKPLYGVGKSIRKQVYDDLDKLHGYKKRDIRSPRSEKHRLFIAVDQALLRALVSHLFESVQNSDATSPKEME